MVPMPWMGGAIHGHGSHTCPWGNWTRFGHWGSEHLLPIAVVDCNLSNVDCDLALVVSDGIRTTVVVFCDPIFEKST